MLLLGLGTSQHRGKIRHRGHGHSLSLGGGEGGVRPTGKRSGHRKEEGNLRIAPCEDGPAPQTLEDARQPSSADPKRVEITDQTRSVQPKSPLLAARTIWRTLASNAPQSGGPGGRPGCTILCPARTWASSVADGRPLGAARPVMSSLVPPRRCRGYFQLQPPPLLALPGPRGRCLSAPHIRTCPVPRAGAAAGV